MLDNGNSSYPGLISWKRVQAIIEPVVPTSCRHRTLLAAAAIAKGIAAEFLRMLRRALISQCVWHGSSPPTSAVLANHWAGIAHHIQRAKVRWKSNQHSKLGFETLQKLDFLGPRHFEAVRTSCDSTANTPLCR
jgi:hypothetical protein